MLAMYAGYKSVTTDPPPQATAAYQTGYRIGGVVWPVVLTAVGLWMLLRDGRRPIQSRSVQPSRIPPRPMPPPAPTQVAVKINCGCGQNYAFEVEPIAGRMPAPVKCPGCAADGTEAANAMIAQTLAARLQTLAQQPQYGASRRRLHPALLVTMLGLLLLLVAVSVSRQLSRRSRISHPRPSAQTSWPAPETSPSQRQQPNPASVGVSSNRVHFSRAGSPRDAAPVPSDVTDVEVLWGNRWWPATILKRDGQRAYVHYERWSSARDEWVTPDRLRPRPPK